MNLEQKLFSVKNPPKYAVALGDIVETGFSAPSKVFSTPTYTRRDKAKGFSIEIQDIAYKNLNIKNLFRQIESAKKYLKTTTYFETQVDINNDGKKDRIQAVKFYSDKRGQTFYYNYPLNQYGNINLAWFIDDGQRTSSIENEIFIYQGRTFLFGLSSSSDYSPRGEITTNEPSNHSDHETVQVTSEVCEISI